MEYIFLNFYCFARWGAFAGWKGGGSYHFRLSGNRALVFYDLRGTVIYIFNLSCYQLSFLIVVVITRFALQYKLWNVGFHWFSSVVVLKCLSSLTVKVYGGVVLLYYYYFSS